MESFPNEYKSDRFSGIVKYQIVALRIEIISYEIGGFVKYGIVASRIEIEAD